MVNLHLANQMTNVELIILDEIVMCHRFCVEATDRTLHDITCSQLPFWGQALIILWRLSADSSRVSWRLPTRDCECIHQTFTSLISLAQLAIDLEDETVCTPWRTYSHKERSTVSKDSQTDRRGQTSNGPSYHRSTLPGSVQFVD